MQQPDFLVGEWHVSPSINQISRPGHSLTLEPQLVDLLLYFAQHPDEVLSRDELIDNVWKRNIVTNHVVTQSISELRKCLRHEEEEESPEYIVTVPKRGYRLAASVSWLSAESEIASLNEGESLQPQSVAYASASPPAVSQPEQKSTPAFTSVSQARSPYRFWVWLAFILSVACGVALLVVGPFSSPTPTPASVSKGIINPRDIDIQFSGRPTCTNWTRQSTYMMGIADQITNLFNTYSTYMVHNQTDYRYRGPTSAGKILTIEFVNQRHYREQQCFMAVRLVDNADSSVMLDRRYFITHDNQLAIQHDLLKSLSQALQQPWSEKMQRSLNIMLPKQSEALQQYYEAHSLLLKGDPDSLTRASDILDKLISSNPDYFFAQAEKALVDILRHTGQPFDDPQLTLLQQKISQLEKLPEIKDEAIYYQINTIALLNRGKIDLAAQQINKSIELEMSWLNYVLLGKVYEMQGQKRLAADAYITAFNLRPGDNILYWIRNTVFQTSLAEVAPYLNNSTQEK
ncbi:transcriptional regulator CadC [Pantoea alhagi]|uniref:Transcriptional regulator CadC n=1 Tax=Pantoea alhagi TaxID=1891675 RepID=A0A1W6B7Z8_9GAMM|nr:lysine decarboxylation/transport transcriptional activator CadC [Pantoea alhagi]ARJ43212.1 transcriptional regulator CadC [Pantoea alhagi]